MNKILGLIQLYSYYKQRKALQPIMDKMLKLEAAAFYWIVMLDGYEEYFDKFLSDVITNICKSITDDELNSIRSSIRASYGLFKSDTYVQDGFKILLQIRSSQHDVTKKFIYQDAAHLNGWLSSILPKQLRNIEYNKIADLRKNQNSSQN